MPGYKWDGKPELRHVAEEPPRETPATAQDRCGTPAGYKRHLRHGEDPCGRCREANREASRAWRALNKPPVTRPEGVYDPKRCGTDKGYHRHRRRGTVPCGPCRAGHAATAADYAARRAA